MKSMKKSIVLALVPFALAACGGGGGGDSAAVDTPTTTTTATTPTTSTDLSAYGLTDADKEFMEVASNGLQALADTDWLQGWVTSGRGSHLNTGSSLSTTSTYTLASKAYKQQLDTKGELETVFIPSDEERVLGNTQPQRLQDVNIYIRPMVYNTANSKFEQFEYFIASLDGAYSYSQFGFAKNGYADPIYIGYYRGFATPAENVPTTGTATYSGDFVSVPSTSNVRDAIGKVQADVDFGNKNVAFVFTLPSGYRGDIDAAIQGSVLLGKDGGKLVEGLFTGSDAGEITGSYTDSSAGVIGVYGAKR